MRFSREIPEIPWPHEMAITVDAPSNIPIRVGPRFNPEFQPPFWDLEHGRNGIDGEALACWQAQLRPSAGPPMPKEPERVCLAALIPAWQTGLTTIITLPYAGYFAERILKTHLVVSNQTREDPDSYSRALGESAR